MKEKACKNCKLIYDGARCPNCESAESTSDFKGRIDILNPEQSEIAKKLEIKKPGVYAVRL